MRVAAGGASSAAVAEERRGDGGVEFGGTLGVDTREDTRRRRPAAPTRAPLPFA